MLVKPTGVSLGFQIGVPKANFADQITLPLCICNDIWFSILKYLDREYSTRSTISSYSPALGVSEAI